MQKDTKDLKEYYPVIFDSYEAILEMCLEEERIVTLYAGNDSKICPGFQTNLNSPEKFVADYIFLEEQRQMKLFLSRENLEAILKNEGNNTIEFRLWFHGEKPVWMQAELLPVKEKQTVLCTIKRLQISERRLFQLGIDQMIFKCADHQIPLNETEKDILFRQAVEEAKTDALTLLYNQKAMNVLVNYELEETQRSGAILFIDLDNFKEINDRFGHLVGDEVLREVADQIRACIMAEGHGIAGRIGGDEFAVFLPVKNCDIRNAAAKFCGYLRESLNQITPDLCLTCSIGIARYPEDGTDYSILLGRADQALYRAKEQGKNQFVFYGNAT